MNKIENSKLVFEIAPCKLAINCQFHSQARENTAGWATSGTRVRYNFQPCIYKKIMHGQIRSHNRGRRPQARGPRKTIEKDKCAIFSENCATLNVINSRGYTQICVGLGDSLQAGLEARLHAIDKSFEETFTIKFHRQNQLF